MPFVFLCSPQEVWCYSTRGSEQAFGDSLVEAVTEEGNYVTGIVGWYPASQNANRDTNANATTRSLKSHLRELIGDDRNVLVYWVDCWQFCHKSSNRSMRYNHIKKFVTKEIEIQRMCADLLAINIAIAEGICGRTILSEG